MEDGPFQVLALVTVGALPASKSTHKIVHDSAGNGGYFNVPQGIFLRPLSREIHDHNNVLESIDGLKEWSN